MKNSKFLKSSLVLFSGVLCAGVSMPLLNTNVAKTYAEQIYQTSESISFSTGNFTGSSSSLNTPSGLTKMYDVEGVKSGAIYLNDGNKISSSNEEKYGLSASTNIGKIGSDSYVLMVNNTTESSKISGFETQNSGGINELSENSFYEFSVWFKTTTSSKGSFYITNTSGEKSSLNLKIEDLSSADWQEQKIYLATNQIQGFNAKAGFYLGSKTSGSTGVVFFDSFTITKICENDFETAKAGGKVCGDLRYTLNGTNTITLPNADFETALDDNWTLVESENVTSGIWNSDSTIEGNDAPKTHTLSSTPTKVLAIASSDGNSGYASYKSTSFKIKNNGAYLLSFWAKNGSSATVNAKIATENFEKNGTLVDYDQKSASLSITKTTNITTNGWKLYSFLIKGNLLYDANCNLYFDFGSKTSKTSGCVFFDEVSLRKLTLEEYEKYSASSSLTTANLSTSTSSSSISIDSQTQFENCFFNFTSKIGFDGDFENVAYPLLNVESFTQNAGEILDTKSGIVNLNNSTEIYGLNTPADLTKASNNALLVHNTGATWQNFKSSSISLASGSYYKISVYANKISGEQNSAYVAICSSTETFAKLFVNQNSWQKKTFYVSTALTSSSLCVELGIGNTENLQTGKVYFDNLQIEKIESNAFLLATNNNDNVIVDFSKELFTNSEESLGTNLKASTSFTIEGENTQVAINVSDDKFLKYENLNYTNSTLTGSKQYALASDKFYKISLSVKLEDVEKDQLSEEENFGLSIAFDGIDQKFENLTTTNGDYITYTFLLKVQKDISTKPILNFGSEDAKVKGTAYLNSIVVEETNSAEFNKDIENASTTLKATIEASTDDDAEETNDDEENEGETQKVKNEFNWSLFSIVFSSIILAVILAIVLIAFVVKKSAKKVKADISKKSKKVQKQVSYSRTNNEDKK